MQYATSWPCAKAASRASRQKRPSRVFDLEAPNLFVEFRFSSRLLALLTRTPTAEDRRPGV